MDEIEINQGGHLFPKISGKHTDLLSHLRRLKEEGNLPEVIDIEGTVKLHGMHADIVYDLRDLSNTTFQSRNRVCAPGDDQHGWPIQLSTQSAALRYLRDEILQAFKWNNPLDEINDSLPVIVAGEWIGEGVQRDVGVSELPTRFVVISVSINGKWQRDSDYRNVRAEKAGIYNVFGCGSQIVTFDTSNITPENPALLEMQRLADIVEDCCPYAATYGIRDSRGEGIVWKPSVARSDPRCWLKTKGPISGKENRIDAERIAADRLQNATLAEAVQGWVTPRRIEQGFEYLLEMKLMPTRDSLKVYIEWMLKDVITEEEGEVQALIKSTEVTNKNVKTKIEHAARRAYLDLMKESGVNLAWAACFDGPRNRSILEEDFV